MKRTWLLVLFSLVIISYGFGQRNKSPKNLRSAMVLLDADVKDSLKLIIKQTPDDDLLNTYYYYSEDFKNLYRWIGNEDSKFVKYLKSKGIQYYVEEAIVKAYKMYLLEGKLNEAELFKFFKAPEQKFAESEKIRYITDSLNGEYIPKDLEECINQLDYFWNDSLRNEIRKIDEFEFVTSGHMSIGMSIRNNWQLWGGSRLSLFFNENGIDHPDEMAEIILKYYHRHLMGIKVTNEMMIKDHDDYIKEIINKYMLEFPLGDTVYYRFPLGFSSSEQKQNYRDGCNKVMGIIIGNDEKIPAIKVRVVENGGFKPVLYIDAIKHEVFLTDTVHSYKKIVKRATKKIHIGQETWFYLNSWTTDKSSAP